MDVRVASLGFCIGIDRAYRGFTKRALSEGAFTATHQNSASTFDTLRRIERREPELLARYPALDRIDVKHDVAEMAPGEKVVLGFHGLTDKDKRVLSDRGAIIAEDLICPFIAKLDRVVERHAEAGFDIAIVGTHNNHHVTTARRIAEQHGRRCFTIVSAVDIDALPFADGRPIVLVGQVTGNTEVFHDTIDRISAAKLPVKVMRTMCADSHKRQQEAVDLARRADLVIVLDDGGDGSQSVYEVCARANANIRRIQRKHDLQPHWFAGVSSVALVGGILVPEWSLGDTADHIRQIGAEAKQPGLEATS